jgi:GAF domain-containing protein
MVPEGIADLAPWTSWSEAADGALRFLYEYVGWDVWLVTCVEGDRQTILRSHPESVVRPGTVLRWEDSFCRQMIEGKAPRMATVTAAVPAYSTQCSGPVCDIAAYVSVPLVRPDLHLFGTLCGLSTRARPRSAARDLPLVESVARLLSTVLAPATAPAAPAPPRARRARAAAAGN